ncbi:MAG: hypothetical protein EPN89_09055 [Methylovulum sp.]|nr:MAG: hypothetical protein EPN89_09055 [Methylovulum sp.]
MIDKKNRHERARRLFDIEEREQELSGIAHAATRDTGETVETPFGGSRILSPNLSDLARYADAEILATHHRLRAAHAHAERLAAEDPELARLNALVYGLPSKSAQRVGEVIEGEATEVAP